MHSIPINAWWSFTTFIKYLFHADWNRISTVRLQNWCKQNSYCSTCSKWAVGLLWTLATDRSRLSLHLISLHWNILRGGILWRSRLKTTIRIIIELMTTSVAICCRVGLCETPGLFNLFISYMAQFGCNKTIFLGWITIYRDCFDLRLLTLISGKFSYGY